LIRPTGEDIETPWPTLRRFAFGNVVMKLNNALVIGAGIGGLTAAIALAQRGVAVTVLEQTDAIREVGAGLQISPNGLAVLRALRLERALEDKRAVQARAVVLRAFDRAGEVARLDLTRQPDQRYLFVHRADIIDLLAQAARRANVSLELGVKVAEVTPGDALPSLTVEDGTTRQAELILGADGLHSRARTALNGPDAARFTGQVAWRATIPNVVDHPPEAQVTMGAGRHLVSYPLRGGTLVNLVAVEERTEWAAEGWHHADDPANLRAAFADFGGKAGAMLAEVTQVSLWGLHRHPVAGCWHKEGVALLGDAAHPTLPFLAQGANMALEDAWVLTDTLSALPIDDALAAYQSRRHARVTKVINTANRNAWRYHLRRGPVRSLAHAGLTAASRFAPGRMLSAFDWLYHHDVTKDQGV